MRQPQEIIEFVKWGSGTLLREAYEPRQFVGWRAYAQRIAIWILEKLKCQAPIHEEHWAQRHSVPGDIGELLHKQLDILMDKLSHYDGEIVVVVGYEEFRRLMDWGHRSPQEAPVPVNTSLRVGRMNGAVDRHTREPVPSYTVYGFRVIMVPWLTGLHVLPKDYLL